jgi:hypothetical protein
MLNMDLVVDGTPVGLTCAPDQDPPALSVAIDCGALPSAQELEGWLELLDANFTFHGSSSPCFCRGPGTGTVTLQAAFDLRSVTAKEVFMQLRQFTRIAAQWRARHSEMLP